MLVVALALPKVTKPQSVSTLSGGRTAALAFNSSTLQDEWSLYNNVAGLSAVEKKSVNSSFSINSSQPGSNITSTIVTLPSKIGNFATGLFRFGDDLYSEQLVSAGFSNQLGLASLGVSANLIQYRAEGYNTLTTLGLNFGGIAKISKRAFIGAYITNLNQPRIVKDTKETLPSRLVVGTRIHPTDKISVLAEIEKDLRFKPTLKAGLEYSRLKKFDLRAGINLNPYSICGGFGFKSHRLRIDYATQYTQYIDFRFTLSATYLLPRREHE